MASPIAEKVFGLIKETVEAQGVSLWDVKYVKEGASYYLRVILDSAEGISIDDCTNVHHAIDPVLDEADPIRDSYFLEVCSPGLERELSRPEHFEKYKNADIKLKLYKAVNGSKELKGKLISFDGKEIVIEAAGEELTLEKSAFSSCRLDDMDF